jgi:hypothetical protein
MRHNDDIKITISTSCKFRPLRAIYAALVFVIMIGLGVAVESTAMQWAGFILSWFLIIIIAVNMVNCDKGLTINEARKRLDEIERETKHD